ncbi:hypothetical protein ABIE67_000613 [Streptomyces sp. V4I8]
MRDNVRPTASPTPPAKKATLQRHAPLLTPSELARLKAALGPIPFVDLFSVCGGSSHDLEEAGHLLLLGMNHDPVAVRTHRTEASKAGGRKRYRGQGCLSLTGKDEGAEPATFVQVSLCRGRCHRLLAVQCSLPSSAASAGAPKVAKVTQ